jgi:hypothetical protein
MSGRVKACRLRWPHVRCAPDTCRPIASGQLGSLGPVPDIRENDMLRKLRLGGRICVLRGFRGHAHRGARSSRAYSNCGKYRERNRCRQSRHTLDILYWRPSLPPTPRPRPRAARLPSVARPANANTRLVSGNMKLYSSFPADALRARRRHGLGTSDAARR